MKQAEDGKYVTMNINHKAAKAWYKSVQDYLYNWVQEHKELKFDSWTPESKQAINKEGVWK
jgi:hypothetical protein